MTEAVMIKGRWFYLETCIKCKTEFAISQEVYTVMNQLNERGSFYCPIGHGQHYVSGKSEIQKLQEKFDNERRARERLEQSMAQRDDELAHKDRQIAHYKGNVTKIKNRLKVGICPCCNRHFVNLERHMATKHPDFTKEEIINE